MERISTYISEKLRVTKSNKYSCRPKTKKELRKILEERLSKDKDADLNDIDVSLVEDMSYLFYRLDPHKIDISQWDVSNVKNMEGMFYNCNEFNSDLSQWDVSSVTNIGYMFYNCKNFNSDLSQWDVYKVKYMSNMFNGCTSLEKTPSWYRE